MAKEKSKPEREAIAIPSTWGSRRVESELTAINLTPSQIRNWLLEAETGEISSQCELFEQMERRDAELDGHLRTRKNAVASLGYEILPADDSSEAEAAAEYARDVVDGIANMRGAVFDLLDAIGKGFSILEIGWETSTKEWRPAKLEWKPQRWFTVGDDGMTLFLKGDTGSEKIELNPLNFIIHRAQARSGFLNNWSLLKSCVRPFVMRQYGVKDWLGFVEVYGMPARVGYLREGVAWDSAEATQFKAALRAMGVDMSMLLREGNRIDFPTVGVTAEGKVFPAILEFAEKEMTKAILGQLLTSGGEAGGSYALGKVQNQVRGDLTETDALALDETQTQQLLKPIIRLNKGPNAPVPHWHSLFAEPEDLPGLATTVKTLVDAGQPIPQSWVREKFNIPEPEGDEPVLEPRSGGTPTFANEATEAQRTQRTATRGGGRTAKERTLKLTASGLILNQAGVPVRPERGLEWLAERRVATPETWQALSPAGKARAWYVTGLPPERIATCADLLTRAVGEGRTLDWFLGQTEGRGIAVTGAEEAGAGQMPNWQAQLVYNNSVANAVQADNYIKAVEGIAERPIGEWLVGPNPCEICVPLDGKRAPINGVFFASHWPQLHHGCECDVVTISLAEAEAEGLPIDDSVPMLPGEVWQYDRRDAYYLESRGQTPRTEVGARDRDVLSGLPKPEELL